MSLLVLETLVRYLAGNGLMRVMTGDASLAKRFSGQQVISMPRLTATDARALIRDLLGPVLLRSKETLEQLLAHSDGWPGPLRECILPFWRNPGGEP